MLQTHIQMDGRSEGQTDNVKTVYPPTNIVCGGYNYLINNIVLLKKGIVTCNMCIPVLANPIFLLLCSTILSLVFLAFFFVGKTSQMPMQTKRANKSDQNLFCSLFTVKYNILSFFIRNSKALTSLWHSGVLWLVTPLLGFLAMGLL